MSQWVLLGGSGRFPPIPWLSSVPAGCDLASGCPTLLPPSEVDNCRLEGHLL